MELKSVAEPLWLSWKVPGIMQLEGKQDFCTESIGEGKVPVGVAALSLLRKLQEKGEHRNFSTGANIALPPRIGPKPELWL